MTQPNNQPEQPKGYGVPDGVQDLCAFGGITLVGYGGYLFHPAAGLVAAGLMLFWVGTRG